MGAAVGCRVVGGIAQAEVRAEVDDSVRKRAVVRDAGLGQPVRHRQEQHVDRRECLARGEAQRRLPAQVGVNLVHEAAHVPLGRDLRHLDAGMPQQQAQQFAARVTGRASDAHRQPVRAHATTPTASST